MVFKHGFFATAFSVRAVFNWTLERIVWSETQVGAEIIQSNVVDIFRPWILSCIYSLEIVCGDCSIFCGGCPWIWNGCIENWYLFPVEVTCDCKDRFVFSWIMESCGIRACSFCNRIIIVKVIELVCVADLLVGAWSGCRDAFKAILSRRTN